MTPSLRLMLVFAAATALGACITQPWLKPPIVNPQTASRETAPAARCPSGEIRSYRPSPRNEKSAPYDATIPPDYDVPSRLPSECKRERN